MLLLLLLAAAASGTSSSSSSSSGSSANGTSSAEVDRLCRNEDLAEMMASTGMSDHEVFVMCNDVCPMPKAADLKTACDNHHTHHDFTSVFRDAQTAHPRMQWCAANLPEHRERACSRRGVRRCALCVGRNIFFISMILLIGAISRECIPSWIPYTVFILVICFCYGLLATVLYINPSCPHHAFAYRGSDNFVSRAEWSRWLCEGCNTTSYCLSQVNPKQTRGSEVNFRCAACPRMSASRGSPRAPWPRRSCVRCARAVCTRNRAAAASSPHARHRICTSCAGARASPH
jgi:hypothetical protein